MATYPLLVERDDFRKRVPATLLKALSDDDLDVCLRSGSDVAYSYLGDRYTLPLTAYGFDLRRVVCDVVTWHVLGRRGGQPANPADPYLVSYQAAIRWLESVRDRKTSPAGIEDSAEAQPPTVGHGRIVVVTSPSRGW